MHLTEKTRAARAAFTLIELLIVVAIIAILAAIAVPNFLEAQTRAKISRSKADMRTVTIGLESYRVDSNHYPPATNVQGRLLTTPAPGDPSMFETLTSPLLTTPIAYLTSLPRDVFSKASGTPGGELPLFHFGTAHYTAARAGGSILAWEQYQIQLLGESCETTVYNLAGHGPDGDHDIPGIEAGAVLYDPTNGTVSNGDIIYFGPCHGFKN